MLHNEHSEPVAILLTHSSKGKAQPTHKLWLLCANVLHRRVHTGTHVIGKPCQANLRAGSEQQHSQQKGRGPCQHSGHQCDDLRATCTARQAICSGFGPDGAFQGVILVLANGNNHAWLSQVHRSLWRIG